ncbi:YdcF family protein [Alteromonas sp. 1_MG-2023]|uniref:YdcF family protein n=1 Tax=Alteromonas sp. 1_MG-2023 TaxID=3062669 RepID=UPI0026E13557|nr:YdcF family protein [Alteromonas sp. 1_MG-2023]MDO6566308.1 YdcF family protein [Alteromonas sp. 1_MG-2023]
MISFFREITLFIISPLCLIAAFFAASLWLLYSSKVNSAKLLLSITFISLMIFSQSWVSSIILYPLEFGFDEESETFEVPEYIYTPACYYSTHGSVPEISRWHECSLQRLLQAKMLSEQYRVPLILTGGNFLFDETIGYAVKAQELLVSLGMSADNIITLNEGTSTFTEIRALEKSYANAKVLAVTSATHQRRVSMMLKDADIRAIVKGVDFQSSGELKPFVTTPSASSLDKTRKAFYEYIALLKYLIFGN